MSIAMWSELEQIKSRIAAIERHIGVQEVPSTLRDLLDRLERLERANSPAKTLSLPKARN